MMVFRTACALALVALAMPIEAQQPAGANRTLAKWDQDAHPDLKGVIILRKGHAVAERYYNGETAATPHDIRSAAKSVTSLLFGIAQDRRLINNVDDPVAKYWPEARGTAIGDVPLRAVLTMRSGLAAVDVDPASPGQEDKLDRAPDPERFILGLPRADPPLSTYRYNSVTASVAGIVVARAAHQTLADFAQVQLFKPMRIAHWQWQADTGGYTKGQGNLSLTLRDFAALGEMVREHGVYHGRRIVSASWINQALNPKVEIAGVDPYADGYGYFWYSKLLPLVDRKVPVLFASGNGGNKLYIVPSLDLVVAITSSAYGQSYGQKRSEDILKAVLTTLLSKKSEAAKL